MMPKLYLLIDNPSRSNNLGPILRCCSAFTIHQVIFVGFSTCSVDGSHGSHKALNTTHYTTWDQAISYVRDTLQVPRIMGLLGSVGICNEDNPWNDETLVVEGGEGESIRVSIAYQGVVSSSINEIKYDNDAEDKGSNSDESNKMIFSFPIHTRPFQADQDVCLIINKQMREGIQLFERQLKYCDNLLHIPTSNIPIQLFTEESNVNSSKPKDKLKIEKYTDINESLNKYIGLQLDAPTCLSIICHHFTSWAKYSERRMLGQKFEVEYPRYSQDLDQQVQSKDSTNRVHLERIEQQENSDKAVSDTLEDGDWATIFTE